MRIIAIKTNNFKVFEEPQTFGFKKINLIKGKNGTGKTTIAVETVLFAGWGYTPKDSLQKLPTRWSKKKNCEVQLEVVHKGKTYIINRKYPTSIKIIEDGIEISQKWTNAETQKYINKLFGDIHYFKQFRMVDKDVGINILDQGPSALKQILFSVSESIFNDVKNKLLVIKRERELYNRDTAVVYPYYPSERRLETLELEMLSLDGKIEAVNKKITVLYNNLRPLENAVSMNKNSKRTLEQNKTKLIQNPICYACKRGLEENKRNEMIKEFNKKLGDLDILLTSQIKKSEEAHKIWEQEQIPKTALISKKNKAKELYIKLENRVKLKAYKYTNRDIVIVKKAIDELDKISTYYLTESVKILEPIINSILSKIDFKVKFAINEQNKFTITLEKDGIEYTYSDLSEGQKLLVQIGFKLALLMERGEEGLIIADEGFSSLDSDNLLHIVTMFQNLPFQLYLVLHHAPELPDNINVINLNEGD